MGGRLRRVGIVNGAASLGFVPYHQLDGQPNVVVDGSPTDGTELCLTHWPAIDSPIRFAADLSAQMAFAYLDAFDLHDRASAVSNNHFDQDGLVSLYALIRPEAALERRAMLIDVARAGDFATFDDRNAARVSMTLAAYATPGRSPLGDLPSDYAEMTAQLYVEMLGRIDELCDHPERYHDLWAEEDATLDASEAALGSGQATLEEVPDIDLAVITVPKGGPCAGGHRFGGQWASGLHPMAIYNATDRFSVLVIREQHYDFTYRYESWVQYRSRRPRPRRDLAALVERLNDAEPSPGRWGADPVSVLTPTLQLRGADQSAISPAAFREILEHHLRHAPPAWNPYPDQE